MCAPLVVNGATDRPRVWGRAERASYAWPSGLPQDRSATATPHMYMHMYMEMREGVRVWAVDAWRVGRATGTTSVGSSTHE